MRQTLYEYCKNCGKEVLLRQWHPTKNGPMTPETVSYGSKKKIWWCCERGHEWQSALYTRTSADSGCPYCAGKRVWAGENDLASQRPDLIVQWDFAKNGTMSPEQIAIGSHKEVWWICEKGHEWRAMVKSRVSGCGCPVCANRVLSPGENDLAFTHPDLTLQWHPVKNGDLTPRNVMAGTLRKVWWKCEQGHEWKAAVAARTSGGTGCPVCSGKFVVPGLNDLASQFPAIAAQWHPEKNGTLTPEQVAPGSNRKVWWYCECSHAYQAAVSSRVSKGCGCPYCTGRKVLPGFNDLATLEPQLAAQWHPTLNGALTPQMVTVGSHRKVWWECPVGHIWKAVIHSRAGGKKCGCPACAGRVKPDSQRRYAVLAESPNDI